jgi:Xaa-Pro dipeptidase
LGELSTVANQRAEKHAFDMIDPLRLQANDRRAQLESAQKRAFDLFGMIERSCLIRAGVSERQIEDEIGELAAREFGVKKHWHRRIVRAGPNTITIAAENPPPRIIQPDDIVYVDLGPVFEDWEADVGRSYALSSDADKRRLIADLPRIFEKVQAWYHRDPDMSGAALYAYAQDAAVEAGWRFGGQIAGHIVSEFAHALIPGDKALNRISPLNSLPMNNLDGKGQVRHWILEIHLVATNESYGGFYERLL